MMMNDPFVIEQAGVWAQSILSDEQLTTTERVELMFKQAFARGPSKDELVAALEFLRNQAATHGHGEWSQSETAWTDLAHVFFNTKEFMFIP